MGRRRALPPLALVGALGVQRLVSPGRHRTRSADAAAATLAAISLGLWWGSVVRFHLKGTTVDPDGMGRSSTLVTDGVNAVTRNPMYVGMAGVLTAHALHLRSAGALIPAAVHVALMDRVQIPAEEAALEAIFGADFVGYCARTPRWL